MLNYNAKIQELSALRAEIYEEAGKFNHSNPEHAKRLWSAADAVVNYTHVVPM